MMHDGPPTAPPFVHASAPAPAQYGYAPARQSYWWVWLIVFLSATALVALFVVRWVHAGATAAGAGGKFAKGGPMPVVTAVVAKGDINIYINGLGTVTAFNSVLLRSRVDGELVKVNFVEGQFVHQGDLLAQIDPSPYKALLLQAQGQLAKDTASLTNAQLDLKRYQDLLKQNLSITQQQVDTQQAMVGQIQGSIEADKGQIATATVNLKYCDIAAPLTGRIGLRLVDQGNIVHANDTGGLAVIAQLQPIAVIFTVPQDDIPRVEKAISAGKPVAVDAFGRDLKSKLAAGTLLATDNQVDPATGTLRIKASFPNADNVLFPNEFVNARLLVDELHGVTVVPSAAVQRGPETNPIYVYVVKPDKTVELKDVKIGPSEGDQTVIESGLSPGEVVVTAGVDKLQSGSQVTVGKPTGTGATTRPAGAATRSTNGDGKIGAARSRGATTQAGGQRITGVSPVRMAR